MKLKEIYEIMKSFKSGMFEFGELKELLEITNNEPVELAYGYTVERETLTIILYKDKFSRILTNSQGEVLGRLDFVKVVDLNELVGQHKRFYPNRVNEDFKMICELSDVHLSITNTPAKGEPKFDFE